MSNPKILLVADKANWAYHEIQKYVSSNLLNQYDFYTEFAIFYKPKHKITIKHKMWLWLERIKAMPYRRITKDVCGYDIVVLLGFYFDVDYDISVNGRFLIKGIYTDGFPPAGVDESDNNISIQRFVNKYLCNIDYLICGSSQIKNRYIKYFPALDYVNGNMSAAHFSRISPKLKNISKQFIVGWTGNPSREFKGFYDYVVPAIDEAKKILQDVVDYIANPELYERSGAIPDKGYLLTGVTRTGKTEISKALAGEINFILQQTGQGHRCGFKEITWAEIARPGSLKKMLVEAKKHAPCVLFIDELHNYNLQGSADAVLLNDFLTAMSGIEQDEKNRIILVATTNQIQKLDNALFQHGRFGTIIHFELPRYQDRKHFF